MNKKAIIISSTLSIEKLISIERPSEKQHGKTHRLYEAARKKFEKPPTLYAAERLIEDVKPGDTVIFLTGAYHPVRLPKGETDGPPGVAALARALDIGIGAKPVVICEEQLTDVLKETCIGAGLVPMEFDEAMKRPHSVVVRGFPLLDIEHSKEECRKVIEEFKPKAIIAIEKKGRNSKGVLHNPNGTRRDEEVKVDYMVDEAKSRGILTIGVADGGNEIGCGVIYEEVRKEPYGSKCVCPCGGGYAPVVKTDILVFSGISNWGAYGIEACLAILLKNQDVIHDGSTEERILRVCANTGCADGVTLLSLPTVDATGDASIHIVELLRLIVCSTLAEEIEIGF